MTEKDVRIKKRIFSSLTVVSIGHCLAFYVVFFPLEYIQNIPPHSIYVIVFFCTFGRIERGCILLALPLSLRKADVL